MPSPIRWPSYPGEPPPGMSTGWLTSTTPKPIAGSPRAGDFESTLQMLLQARHQLDEIAGTKAVVELVHEDPLPGVAAGARRTGQSKEVGAAGDPGRRAALDRRGPDLVVAEPAEELAKAGNLLLVDTVKRLGCDVSSGDPGAAGRDHDVDVGIGDPFPELRDDLVLLVTHDLAGRDPVPCTRHEIGERVTRTVLRCIPSVGDCQDRDVDGQKRAVLIDPARHSSTLPVALRLKSSRVTNRRDRSRRPAGACNRPFAKP